MHSLAVMSNAILALEDGTVYQGESFGAVSPTAGEICFNTAMTGYQEILTDPSSRGQIVAMTYPHIGNTGVNALDVESARPQIQGLVIEELSPVTSNWRSDDSLHHWLAKAGVPGIQGIDTRALTRKLRTGGVLRAAIVSASEGIEAAVARARGAVYEGHDFVREVTARRRYTWDPEGTLSGRWEPYDPRSSVGTADATGNVFVRPPPVKWRIAAYDFGVKVGILRSLRQAGFDIEVFPADAPAAEILESKPDGLFLSNGPGDPEALDYARGNVRALMGRLPIFGICLGHQILALALGGRTFKLKFGHRGANHPVKDLRTGRIVVTAQNHGYAVDPDSLPPEVEVTHVNLNDGTVAGLRHRAFPITSVQYHPEASPGPYDAGYFFEEFGKEIEASSAAA